jgi:glycogen(starch) synthase
MRVLMLSWEYPPVVVGGLGRHVHALATALCASGHDVTVVTRSGPDTPREELREGVRVVRAGQDPAVLPFSDLLAWTMGLNHALTRAALRATEDGAPEVLHAHDWLVAHTATTLKEHLRLPLVATLHATEAGRHQGWLPGPLNQSIHSVEWWLTYEARRVITCSEYMRWEVTRLFDLPPDKVDVLGNGVRIDEWTADPGELAAARTRWTPPGSGPLVVLTARLEWEKGVHTALRAMARLRRTHPGVRLVVVGTGTQADALREQARRLRLGRSVGFAGGLAQPELAALVAAADVALVPSLYEPFGLVALEAAAAGTPLVVSDTGGLREFVEDGVSGVRVPPDDPAALAGAIRLVLDDHVLARRLAREAAVRVRRDHSWQAIAEATAGVYRRAIAEERALQAGLAQESRPPLRVAVREGNLLGR